MVAVEEPVVVSPDEERIIIACYVPEMLGPSASDWLHGDEPPCGPSYEDIPSFSRDKVWG